MTMRGAEELAHEQAHLDRAHRLLEERQSSAKRMQSTEQSRSDRFTNRQLTELSQELLARFERVGDSVCVGRLDTEEGATVYVGREPIFDGGKVIVSSWRSDAALPWYTATPDQPQGIGRRRRFLVEDRRLLRLDDEVLGALPPGL